MNKISPLIIITGPTAAGKTGISIELAKRINGEIISADSMQVYREMDIGTAKIKPEEMSGIRHHLIDVLNPDESFNVVEFCRMAKSAIKDILSKGKLPIIVGGTGFYIQALLYDIDFSAGDENSEYRNELYDILKKDGPLKLHELLKAVDAQSAFAIHPNNTKRVIRALEFYKETGKKISEHNKEEAAKESPYNFAYFVLNDDREIIYENIDKRVDLMIEEGLEAEVKTLLDKGYDAHCQSMLGIGYKEFIDFFEGKYSREEAIRLIKRESRHYAKKQITWFKREKSVIWLNKSEYMHENNIILDKMILELKNRGIVT